MGCPRCGSWAVRADRSLGGRMVCGRCGTPLGIRAGTGRRQRLIRRSGPAGRWLGLIALLAAASLLTLAAERQAGAPGSRWMWPSPDRSDPDRKESGIMFRNIAL